MNRPRLWLLEPNRFNFRVEFRFVDQGGALLESKVWEVQHDRTSPPKTLLLQANAQLAKCKPLVKELGQNYFRITTTVLSLDGNLITSTFDSDQTDAVNQQLAAHAVTMGIFMDEAGIHFSLHTATEKP